MAAGGSRHLRDFVGSACDYNDIPLAVAFRGVMPHMGICKHGPQIYYHKSRSVKCESDRTPGILVGRMIGEYKRNP